MCVCWGLGSGGIVIPYSCLPSSVLSNQSLMTLAKVLPGLLFPGAIQINFAIVPRNKVEDNLLCTKEETNRNQPRSAMLCSHKTGTINLWRWGRNQPPETNHRYTAGQVSQEDQGKRLRKLQSGDQVHRDFRCQDWCRTTQLLLATCTCRTEFLLDYGIRNFKR